MASYEVMVFRMTSKAQQSKHYLVIKRLSCDLSLKIQQKHNHLSGLTKHLMSQMITNCVREKISSRRISFYLLSAKRMMNCKYLHQISSVVPASTVVHEVRVSKGMTKMAACFDAGNKWWIDVRCSDKIGFDNWVEQGVRQNSFCLIILHLRDFDTKKYQGFDRLWAGNSQHNDYFPCDMKCMRNVYIAYRKNRKFILVNT